MSELGVVGELTIQVAAEQKIYFLSALDDAPDRLRVDLAQVTEMDSAGLQVLLLLAREAQRSGKELALVGHSQPVLGVLRLSHLRPDLTPNPPVIMQTYAASETEFQGARS